MEEGPATIAFDLLMKLQDMLPDDDCNECGASGNNDAIHRSVMDACRNLIPYITKERNGEL